MESLGTLLLRESGRDK